METFFISRMLNDLGYKDSQIKTKETLETIAVSRGGRQTEKYKPDFALTVSGAPRCIIDAKAIRENPAEWVSQCSGYCLALNQRYPAKNPVKYFVLSNGIKTLAYQWDNAEPINDLDFSDFEYGNPKYERLKKLLSAKDIISASSETLVHNAQFILTRPTSERARQLFSQCHKAIWKAEVRSPSGAFMAFVKVMFVKLWADKRLRQNPATSDYFKDGKESVSLPASAVVFSERWTTEREEEGAANAIDTILFERLREEIEREIHAKKKKRIFNKGERIGLRSHTVRETLFDASSISICLESTRT